MLECLLLGYILYKEIKRPIIFLAKKELFQGIYQWIGFSFLLKKMQMIPIDRKGFDRKQEALTKGTTLLSQDHIIGIFPEGTRTKTGKLRRFRLGAVKMAAQTQKDIIPAAIVYENKKTSSKSRNQDCERKPADKPIKYGRHTIHIHFGPAITPIYLEEAEKATQALRERIQSLMDIENSYKSSSHP